MLDIKVGPDFFADTLNSQTGGGNVLETDYESGDETEADED